MTQNQKTGSTANEFGRRMAQIVSEKIGATEVGAEGNEFDWNGKRIVIKSAHRDNDYIGVLYSMLDRVDSILAALETTTRGTFQVWEIGRDRYLERSKPQSKNPDIAQISKKEFTNPKHLSQRSRYQERRIPMEGRTDSFNAKSPSAQRVAESLDWAFAKLSVLGDFALKDGTGNRENVAHDAQDLIRKGLIAKVQDNM